MVASSKHSQIALGVAVGSVGLVTVAGAIWRRALCGAARKSAVSPFEYHVVVHRLTSRSGAFECTLVKIPKSASFEMLVKAVALTFEMGSDQEGRLQLFPVLRAGWQPQLGELLSQRSSLNSFDAIIAQLAPENLQVVELLCVLKGEEMPEAPPPQPGPFPTPGLALPFIGHSYIALGAEQILSYNMTKWVFPANASKYPYGSTVRAGTGQRAAITDFPAGTVFHKEACTHTTNVADAEVVREVLARSADFPKMWNRAPQLGLKEFTGNGLFTSSETSEDWQTAHSILPRGFNQIKVKIFAPQILAKTRAFVQEWSNFPAGHTVEDVNHWLTAMTADAVVSCSMGLDMRNVERMGQGAPPHPFIENFRFGLGVAAGGITTKSEYGFKRFIPGFGATAKIQARCAKAKLELEQLIEQMVEQTRAGELGGKHSIIRSMLQEKSASGKHVRYGALYSHIINLMIAGHETTAATLGFTLQLLAESPEYEARAYDEVRRVLGGKTEPDVDDVPKLQFVEQCFREALRLYSPVTSITRDAAYDTLLGGRRIFQGERINIIARALHTNPEYWGGEFGDPYSYNPDRFSPEAVKKRHPNAYHPWGFGTRSCIGSQFALFEAKTFLASMLLHFKLIAVPGYKLKATVDAGGAAPSPHKLALTVFPRPGGPLFAADGSMRKLPPLGQEAPIEVADPKPTSARESTGGIVEAPDAAGPVMRVLYGSNSGASQEFAAQVASMARNVGFITTLSSLDQAVEEHALVPDGRLIVIVTSTYNGNPPDNAVKFKAWLAGSEKGSLAGMRFAVFGVGNSQWQTYQQFPKQVDALLGQCGAQRVQRLGACDVDGASFESDFDDWVEGLRQTVGGVRNGLHTEIVKEEDSTDDFVFVEEDSGVTPDFEVFTDIKSALAQIVKDRAVAAKAMSVDDSNLFQSVEVVRKSRELCQDARDRSVRVVTLRLPCGEYRAGDHLEVLPPNDPMLVDLALSALGLDGTGLVRWDMTKGSGTRTRSARDSTQALSKLMPVRTITVRLVLEWFPDLAAVPARKVLARLAESARGDASQALQLWASDPEAYSSEVSGPQLSLAEVLHLHRGSWGLTLGRLCAVAKPLAPRYYSISSSPAGALEPRDVTVSVGQVEFQTGTGRHHRGLASSHLARMSVGEVVPACVRRMDANFHLPEDTSAPIIMVGPGTGIAPMIGFLQEREHALKQGNKMGPAILFFGCRRRDQDYLYCDELEAHLQSGALTELHVAFSREGPQKVYVQDTIMEQCHRVWKLLQQPQCRILVCGDARAMAPDVRRAFERVAEECGGKSSAKAAGMVAAMLEGGRYVEDVWAN